MAPADRESRWKGCLGGGGTQRVTGVRPPPPAPQQQAEMVLGELTVKPPTSRVSDGTYFPLFDTGETFFFFLIQGPVWDSQ